MKSKHQMKKEWILNSLYITTYNEEEGERDITETLNDKEKLQHVAGCLIREAFYPYNVQRHKGNAQNIIADHLQGLPSYVKIPFANCEILELARAWGYDVATEKKENKLLENYWNGAAMELLKEFKKNNISLEYAK